MILKQGIGIIITISHRTCDVPGLAKIEERFQYRITKMERKKKQAVKLEAAS